jgi:hypothetical protein
VTDPKYAEKHGIDLGKRNKFFNSHKKYPYDKKTALWHRCIDLHKMALEFERDYWKQFRVVYFSEWLSNPATQEEILRWMGYSNPIIKSVHVHKARR